MTQTTTVSNNARLLAPLFLGTFMGLLDVSIVTIALPSIQSDLSATLTDLQWVVDGYIVALAAFMLTGGALADRYGRKRVFLTGVAVFTLASLGCGLAGDVGWLVAARAVQGMAASVLTPGAMSLIAQAYQEPAQRARMIGLFGSVASLAFILGPLVGGPLTELLGWRSVFFLNLPLALLVLLLGRRHLTESADPEHAATDPAGQVLAVAWIGALTYAVIHAGHRGWTSPVALVAFGVAALALGAFLVVELREERPMLPVRLLARAEFGLINLASFAMGFGTFATFFLLSLYLQSVRGASPTEAGLQFLPYVVANTIAAVVAGRLVARFGPTVPLLAGYAMLTAALFGTLVLAPDTPYLVIAGLFVLTGFGLSTAGVPTSTIALQAVPRHQSGIASATVTATRQTGTALGVAVLGALVAAGPTFVAGLHQALLVAGTVTGVATLLLLASRVHHARRTAAPPRRLTSRDDLAVPEELQPRRDPDVRADLD